MNVGLVYDADYPWDVRVWKSGIALARRGHRVHLVCRNLARRPPDELRDGIHLHRLRPRRSARLDALASFPAFLNPVWIGRIAEVVREHAVEVLLVRDLPLALAAVIAGRRARVPVVLDMAENYPAMLRDVWRFEAFRPQNVLLRNPALARVVEWLAVRLVDHVLVVIEESRDRLLRAGVPAERVSIVRNTPVVELARFPPGWGEPPRDEGRVTAVFVGGIEPMRGLPEALAILAAARRQAPALRLVIIGDGRWGPGLLAEARRLGIAEHVELRGRRDYQRALFEVAGADIGLVPHRVTAHTSSTIPNKLFEYMLLARPVLATDLRPVRRIVDDVGCGLVYRTPDEGVAALVRLQDPALRRALGDRGRHAVLERYRWDRDGAALVRAVEGVAGARAAGARPAPRAAGAAPGTR